MTIVGIMNNTHDSYYTCLGFQTRSKTAAGTRAGHTWLLLRIFLDIGYNVWEFLQFRGPKNSPIHQDSRIKPPKKGP